MALTPREMIAAVTANLKQKTGLTLKEWVKVLRRDGPPGADKAAQRAWLKQTHGLGHVQAGIVVDEAAGGGQRVYEDPVALVDAQYAGAKAELRPLYDALVHIAQRLGSDVRIEPCQTYVPFIRKNQFAVVKPATRTRVDLGLALPEIKPQGRLKAARGLGGGDRITHKIELSELREIDADVVRWMKKAYELARVPVPGAAKPNAKSTAPGPAHEGTATRPAETSTREDERLATKPTETSTRVDELLLGAETDEDPIAEAEIRVPPEDAAPTPRAAAGSPRSSARKVATTRRTTR